MGRVFLPGGVIAFLPGYAILVPYPAGQIREKETVTNMAIRIGEKIRTLRKERNISQETLAQALNLSFQAVSKWETGATLPDVALIPAIASFFGVSTDELFDFNRMEQEKKVEAICAAAYECRGSEPEKAEAILREGLRQFPGNDILLNNLLYTMRSPERCGETAELCRALIGSTRQEDVRLDALRILAETYKEMGETALVAPTLEQIPEIYFSRPELRARLLEGAEALDAAETQFCVSIHSAVEMLLRMAELDPEETRRARYRRMARAVTDVFRREEGEDFQRLGIYNWLRELCPRLGA